MKILNYIKNMNKRNKIISLIISCLLIVSLIGGITLINVRNQKNEEKTINNINEMIENIIDFADEYNYLIDDEDRYNFEKETDYRYLSENINDMIEEINDYEVVEFKNNEEYKEILKLIEKVANGLYNSSYNQYKYCQTYDKDYKNIADNYCHNTSKVLKDLNKLVKKVNENLEMVTLQGDYKSL